MNTKEVFINNEDIYFLMKEIIKLAKFAIKDTKKIEEEITKNCM